MFIDPLTKTPEAAYEYEITVTNYILVYRGNKVESVISFPVLGVAKHGCQLHESRPFSKVCRALIDPESLKLQLTILKQSSKTYCMLFCTRGGRLEIKSTTSVTGALQKSSQPFLVGQVEDPTQPQKRRSIRAACKAAASPIVSHSIHC